MRIVHNEAVGEYAKRRGVFLYELAEAIGLSDGNFTRRLRQELESSEKDSLLRHIDRIAEYKVEQRAFRQEQEMELPSCHSKGGTAEWHRLPRLSFHSGSKHSKLPRYANRTSGCLLPSLVRANKQD